MELKCSICLDKLFLPDVDVSVIQCGHMYHRCCLRQARKKSRNCPNCKTYIAHVVKKIYPDVNDELSYDCCANETKEFVEDTFEIEDEKIAALLKTVKELDKDYASVKEEDKSFIDKLKRQKEVNRGLWEDCKILEVKNRRMLGKMRKFKGVKKVGWLSEAKSSVQSDSYSREGLLNLIFVIHISVSKNQFNNSLIDNRFKIFSYY